jgi:hypothetical protein
MKRLLAALLVVFLFGALLGCGSTFLVRGALNASTISGTVSIVQLTTLVDHGTLITVTLVTFQQGGSASSMNFCGDQRSQFPVDRFVNATFNPGPSCATVIQIVIR